MERRGERPECARVELHLLVPDGPAAETGVEYPFGQRLQRGGIGRGRQGEIRLDLFHDRHEVGAVARDTGTVTRADLGGLRTTESAIRSRHIGEQRLRVLQQRSADGVHERVPQPGRGQLRADVEAIGDTARGEHLTEQSASATHVAHDDGYVARPEAFPDESRDVLCRQFGLTAFARRQEEVHALGCGCVGLLPCARQRRLPCHRRAVGRRHVLGRRRGRALRAREQPAFQSGDVG